MEKVKIILVLFCCMIYQGILSQSFPVPVKNNSNQSINIHPKGSFVLTQVEQNSLRNDLVDYHFRISNTKNKNHYLDSISVLKRKKTELKFDNEKTEKKRDDKFEVTYLSIEQQKSLDVHVNNNFAGIDDPSMFPNDNNIAISNAGHIVSASNSNVSIFNENGLVLYSQSLNTFFNNNPNFTSPLFDPKVMYDNVQDRFILVALQGNNSGSSKLIVAFSSSSDPLTSWNYYWFSTAPIFGAGQWFDYPNIGVNDDYLYVTGNLFNDNNQFTQSVVLQFDKLSGYSGGNNIGTIYWNNIIGQSGAPGFSLYPMSYGYSGEYTGGMLLVSTSPGGANYFQVWNIDNSTNVLTGIDVSSSNYSIGGDAAQFGTNILLDVGDCRVTGGFGIYDSNNGSNYLHFTFTSDYNGSNGYNGMIQAKVTWTQNGNLSSDGVAWGIQDMDLTHSNIAAYGNSVSNNVVLCGLFSSSTNYPSHVVLSSDESYSTTSVPFTILKAGSGFINQSAGQGVSRWGDYMGIARRYSETCPTVWVAGSFGKQSFSGTPEAATWISEVSQCSGGVGGSNTSLNENSENIHFEAYPNPANEKLIAYFELEERQKISIELLNSEGKLVHFFFNDFVNSGKTEVSINTEDLVTGMYYLKVKGFYGQIVSKKIVVK